MTTTLDALLIRYGLEPLPRFEDAPVELAQVDALAASVDNRDAGTLYQLAEVGRTGTLVVDGYIQMEPNPRYEPIAVRGYIGDPGLFEKYGRSEPNIIDAMASIQDWPPTTRLTPTTPGCS